MQCLLLMDSTFIVPHVLSQASDFILLGFRIKEETKPIFCYKESGCSFVADQRRLQIYIGRQRQMLSSRSGCRWMY